MKKVFFYILIGLCLIFGPHRSFGTVVYCDFENGDNGSGNGSAGNPYQDIEYAVSGLTGGDEVRVAKNDDHTALSGTLTFTNGSTSISTSSDLTTEITAGDFVGKNTGNEGWWLVSSVSSDTITLTYQYWGSSEATTGYKLDAYTWGSDQQDITQDGSSTSNRLKITGGWDLTSQERTGYTFLYGNGMIGTAIYLNAANYVELGYFGLLDYYTCFSLANCEGDYIHDIYLSEGGLYNFSQTAGSENEISNIIVTGSTVTGFYATGSSVLNHYHDIYLYSIGTATTDYSFYALNTTFAYNLIESLKIYNAYTTAIQVSGGPNIWQSVVVDTTRSNYGVVFYGSSTSGNFMSSCSTSNANTYGLRFDQSTRNRLYNPTFSGNGSGDININSTYAARCETPAVYVHDYGGTSDDDRIYTVEGIIYRDTTDARSGACLKFDPTTANIPLVWRLGEIKVESVSSDITLKVYLKDDSSFNGKIFLWATIASKVSEPFTEKTPTTSYVENSIVVSSSDLILNEYLTLWAGVWGTAGNAFFDDFSYSQ